MQLMVTPRNHFYAVIIDKFAIGIIVYLYTQGEGDKWKLYIPYDLAYGERGSPPKIPPYNPMVFEIEIHKVQKGISFIHYYFEVFDFN